MILDVIKKLIENQKEHHWYESYWAFDFHGTIINPNHIKGSTVMEFYPYAKETLQLISKTRPDIRMIISTSSYPDEMIVYKEKFEENNIFFHYENENPEINEAHFGFYKYKWYFDIMFEDKSGFNPDEWKEIYYFLKKMKWNPDKEWIRKDMKLEKNIPIRLPDNHSKYCSCCY